MGLVQGEGMAARFFNRWGRARLDRTICSSAGGEALAATYGGKVGMHLEFFAESRLILIWGSNSITSNLHFWNLRAAGQARRRAAGLHRPAAHRDGRQVPPAHRCCCRAPTARWRWR
jgi:anaerobic selenocysteine-containing dehydrogenase